METVAIAAARFPDSEARRSGRLPERAGRGLDAPLPPIKVSWRVHSAIPAAASGLLVVACCRGVEF